MDVIAVGPDGWIDQQEALAPRVRARALAFFREWWAGVTYFHRDGRRYTVSFVRPTRRLGILDRLLASTVYNPILEFAIEYVPGDDYSLPQLREAISTAIRQDDDILTQFHEPVELFARVNTATSFDEVLAVIAFAQTEDDGPDLDADIRRARN